MSESAWKAPALHKLVPVEDGRAATPDAYPSSSLLALSQQRAAGLIQLAREQAEAIKSAAREEGLQLGRAQSQREWEAEKARLHQSLKDWQNEQISFWTQLIQQRCLAYRDELRQNLKEMVLLASSECWERLLAESPQALELAVEHCLSQFLRNCDQVELRIAPGVVNAWEGRADVEVVIDPNLPKHSFEIRSPLGLVKGTLDQILENLKLQLAGFPDDKVA
jgi:flagellar biosynthesis/type III secretory pathway protein FliH